MEIHSYCSLNGLFNSPQVFSLIDIFVGYLKNESKSLYHAHRKAIKTIINSSPQTLVSPNF